MLGQEKYLHRSDLSKTLLELIKIRASQINRCAFCIDMHTKDAKKNGETEQRIYALNAWNEAPFFTPEERAALAMTEAVTLVAGNSISDDLYAEVSRYFTANQIAQILIAILKGARGALARGEGNPLDAKVGDLYKDSLCLARCVQGRKSLFARPC